VMVAQFLRSVVQQADERAVDVAEAEEAEVVGVDWDSSCGRRFADGRFVETLLATSLPEASRTFAVIMPQAET
jgi:hypothetical protein